VNLRELADDYLRRAQVRLRSAKSAFESGDFPDVIRFSQEAVELSLKASLRAWGVEYPKEHDVGEVLISVADRFPPWFREEVDHLAEVSGQLASKRAAAMYGLEVEGKAPGQLFGKDEATGALEEAGTTFDAARQLLKQTR
jgi:HEPN domain-containing protein